MLQMSLFVFNRIDEKRIGNANSDLNFFTNLPHFYLYLVELLRAKFQEVPYGVLAVQCVCVIKHASRWF